MNNLQRTTFYEHIIHIIKCIFFWLCFSMPNAYIHAAPLESSSPKSVSSFTAKLEAKKGQLSIQGACNIMFGGAKISENTLELASKNMASTQKMCAPELMQKDIQLANFLATKPKIVFKNNGYQLVKDNDSTIINILIEGDSRYSQAATEKYITKFIYISAEQKPCKTNTTNKCLQIREKLQDEWQLFAGEIEGFEPYPNIAYRLRIHEFNGTSKRWVLDLVVEQQVIHKENPKDTQKDTLRSSAFGTQDN